MANCRSSLSRATRIRTRTHLQVAIYRRRIMNLPHACIRRRLRIANSIADLALPSLPSLVTSRGRPWPSRSLLTYSLRLVSAVAHTRDLLQNKNTRKKINIVRIARVPRFEFVLSDICMLALRRRSPEPERI